jgi:hypothetical protein
MRHEAPLFTPPWAQDCLPPSWRLPLPAAPAFGGSAATGSSARPRMGRSCLARRVGREAKTAQPGRPERRPGRPRPSGAARSRPSSLLTKRTLAGRHSPVPISGAPSASGPRWCSSPRRSVRPAGRPGRYSQTWPAWSTASATSTSTLSPGWTWCDGWTFGGLRPRLCSGLTGTLRTAPAASRGKPT